MHILIVEKDALAAAALREKLHPAKVDVAEDGLEAVDYCKSYEFSAILVALPVVDMPATQLVRSLRTDKVTAPILVLLDKEPITSWQTIELFNAGADGHMPHDVSGDYLRAYVNAVVRRASNAPQPRLSVGGLEIDLSSRTVFFDNKPVRITQKEYDMMELMALRRGNVVTKEAFMQHMYQHTDEPEIKIVDVSMCKLRKKLREQTGLSPIETCWGRGYVLREPAAA
jgi:two-component system, cell cycle response regulator CtrA